MPRTHHAAGLAALLYCGSVSCSPYLVNTQHLDQARRIEGRPAASIAVRGKDPDAEGNPYHYLRLSKLSQGTPDPKKGVTEVLLRGNGKRGAGIAFMVLGGAFMVGGIGALAATSSSCREAGCGIANIVVGGPILGIGGLMVGIGGILFGVSRAGPSAFIKNGEPGILYIPPPGEL
jgi:hypothetical protein